MNKIKKVGNTNTDKSPEVVAVAHLPKAEMISRRDLLKLAATSISSIVAAPLLGSCGSTEQAPTSTPAPPIGTINSDGTALLAYPGDIANVILTLAAGTSIELLTRDASMEWVKVRITEGNNKKEEGWLKMSEVTYFGSLDVNGPVPVSYEIQPLPTQSIKVEGEVLYSQNIYTTPGDVPTSGYVTQNEQIEILERDSTDTWFKIKTSSGEVGWIQQSEIKASAGYETKVTINTSIVPVVVPPSNPGGSDTIILTYYYPN